MVHLSRLDGTELVVNSDHILTLERTPDTVLMLTTGARLMVKESVEEVVARVVEYRRRIACGPQGIAAGAAETEQGAERSGPRGHLLSKEPPPPGPEGPGAADKAG
jgi:flagellar protein FlbD